MLSVCFRARAMRSVRSRLRLTEAACQSFGRTTGTSRPRSSRMIECTACLRNPVAQSRKLGGQVVVADQTARHARPYPPARIGERRKVAVEDIELEALPRCPCSTGRLIGGDQHDRPAGLARIAPPEDAQPVAFRSHLGALDAVHVSGQVLQPPTAPVCAALPLWRKQVDLPRIRAALHGSPKRFSAVQRGISRFGPLQNRARPIMKFSRCVSD